MKRKLIQLGAKSVTGLFLGKTIKSENQKYMTIKKSQIEKWIAAQKRHRLSDTHVQMARELGLNPDKLGKIDNHRQEPWKAPLTGIYRRDLL